MGEESKIEWTDHTRNFWSGCTKVSPGCLNCYAEKLAKRNTKTFGKWGKGAIREFHGVAAHLELMRWNKTAQKLQRRFRIFPNSMSDWLDDEVPIEWLAAMLDTIRQTPWLDYQLLTKRPGNWFPRIDRVISGIKGGGDEQRASRLLCYDWIEDKPPANIWIGTTVEDQKRADERIPELLSIPARVRFLSCEPLLEAVNLKLNLNGHTLQRTIGQDLHWVITGGESGPGCRPFNPDWARSLRDQCKSASVAYFMKQIGGTRKPFPEIPADLMIREFPTPTEP